MTSSSEPDTRSAEDVPLNVHEIARRLNSALGATLVAAMAGSSDPGVSYSWARGDSPEPRPEEQARLEFGHRVWAAVSSVEGAAVARAWFIGANPRLGDASPVEAIFELRERDVTAAAEAIVGDEFSG